MARYKTVDDKQMQYVPMMLCDLFAADHPVVQLLKLLQEKIDWTEFDNNYNNDEYGQTAFPPDRVSALLIWYQLHGGISMRALDRDLPLRADYMYLMGGLHISHHALGLFLQRHEGVFGKLFTDSIFLASEAGLVNLEVVCIDGTKIKADANRSDIGKLEDFEKRYERAIKVRTKIFESINNSSSNQEINDLKVELAKKQRRIDKIESALQFLKENPDRRRVHLNEPDADWQIDGADGSYMVGYNAQLAVDSQNQIIVSAEVVTQQADSTQTVPMVERTETMKSTLAEHLDEGLQTKYVMDSGYASEGNLEALQGYDLYMPDPSTVRTERAVANGKPVKVGIEFIFCKEDNNYRCPQGKFLPLLSFRDIKGLQYARFQCKECQECPQRQDCIGDRKGHKTLMVRKSNLSSSHVRLFFRSGKEAAETWQNPLTRAMRIKLKDRAAKKVYNLRGQVVEAVNGIITDARNGWQFLRGGLEKVQVDWKIRCAAHNIGKVLGFTRS